MQQLNVAIEGDLNGAVFEPGAHNVDRLRILAEEGVSFNPPTNVERQQAIAATEAKRQPVRGEGAGSKDENVVNRRLVIRIELVELSDAKRTQTETMQ